MSVLNSLLKLRLSNLCKCAAFTGVEIAVLKFTVKIAIYKPMQIRGCRTCGSKKYYLSLTCVFKVK